MKFFKKLTIERICRKIFRSVGYGYFSDIFAKPASLNVMDFVKIPNQIFRKDYAENFTHMRSVGEYVKNQLQSKLCENKSSRVDLVVLPLYYLPKKCLSKMVDTMNSFSEDEEKYFMKRVLSKVSQYDKKYNCMIALSFGSGNFSENMWVFYD